jgi:hypothetical protein
MLSATQISAKWLTNFGNATTSMTDGVNAVTTAPGVAAAAAVTLWMQRLQASQAKWVAKVSAVSLPDWKNAMITLGIPRAQQGAVAKQARYTTFITNYSSFLNSAVPSIKAMPKGTLSQSIARASAMITASYNWGQSNT